MASRKLPPEDLELWRHVAKSVRPIKRHKPRKPAAKAKPEAAAAPPPPGKQKRAKSGPPPAAPAPAPARAKPHALTHGLSHGVDRRQADRFRKGKLAIDGKIDLHGSTQQVAHDDLLAFLRRARDHGKRCVLVVTGKGMTNAKTGILRQAVPRWLNESGFRPLVLAFDYAEPHHGGEGALYVLLKRVRE